LGLAGLGLRSCGITSGRCCLADGLGLLSSRGIGASSSSAEAGCGS
jgi:hypothetical protein